MRLHCPTCHHIVNAILTWADHATGRHIRADCPGCDRWIKFVPQTPESEAEAKDPPPDDGGKQGSLF